MRKSPWLLIALLHVASSASAACTLRVGTSGDYAPFSMKADAADYQGFDIDLARRVGADLGCEVQFVRFEWPRLNEVLASGSVDLVASGISMRVERTLIGRFSRPYAVTGAVALIRARDADRFKTLADLNRETVRVAVNAGGHLERVTRSLLAGATIHPQRDNRSMPRMLRDGTADAVISDSAEARTWMTDALRMLGPFTRDHKALWLPAASKDLPARIDAWLQAREDDGWLQQQRVRYLGSETTMDAAHADREAVAALIELRLGLMPAVGAAKRAAHQPIEDKMQERRVLVRVAAQKPKHATRLANVYRELIAMAKAIQHAHPAVPATATLDALRDAIGRIDERLVPEIDRASGSPDEWLALLKTDLVDGVDRTMVARLAQALADGSPGQGAAAVAQ